MKLTNNDIKFKKPKSSQANNYVISKSKLSIEYHSNLNIIKRSSNEIYAVLNGSVVDDFNKVLSVGDIVKNETLKVSKALIKKDIIFAVKNMSKIDMLLITPPSRLEVYQNLSNDFSTIEPPVWSSLIANYLKNKNFTAKILDAEADHLNHQETAEEILKEDPKLAVFVVYGQQPSASTQCMPASNKTAEILNDISNNEIKTIIVGTHPSALKTNFGRGTVLLCLSG